MRTYSEITEQAHGYFDELDGQIAELEAHAAELREKINKKSGFAIGSVKAVSALRVELEETTATLDRAKYQREKWVDEFSEGLNQEVRQIMSAMQKDLSERYAPKVQELAECFDKARSLLDELEKADKAEREQLQQEANQIQPYVNKQVKDTIGHLTFYMTDLFTKRPEGRQYEKLYDAIKYNK